MRPRQGYAKSMGMPTSSTADPSSAALAAKASEQPGNKRPLPQAAARALAEAAARRNEGGNAEAGKSQVENESGGRGGLDPTRYGDWEINGLASDF